MQIRSWWEDEHRAAHRLVRGQQAVMLMARRRSVPEFRGFLPLLQLAEFLQLSPLRVSDDIVTSSMYGRAQAQAWHCRQLPVTAASKNIPVNST